METITLKTPADLALCDPAPGSLADVPVGRDLDALVAEHVMGWRWIAFRFGGMTGQSLCNSRLVRDHWEKVAHLDVTDRLSRPARAVDWDAALPNYSTDGSALLVLEKMRALGWGWQLTDRAELIEATFQTPGFVGTKGACVTAPTAPEAICRAAVRAVLEKQVNKD